ncbi:MAG: PEPxxWA-CTERM sorting domain-containing protein [Alphaproteobacteria bacterium]|nr:PEPxxWA-CTERM sorting domain-containing protein [Alphaproteobacteria bacterium]MBU1512710.1 PEPxxWA-CTERM sorting domain-containing protein [Alphaproteobacteria bacterium]MBU2096089.1 PEPxxWA-CTERM sorting domain-containing protein [Alphaproteobacteria bacterium]MBU2152445.1 PEPxxWA-CTERM sorting domain-containing protein [Alphaproteobacteria bacterium]MBU2308021.1 PEPxxWA-CTERM sorting domain-containing protein [Alphaproteobacteria bacterium]
MAGAVAASLGFGVSGAGAEVLTFSGNICGGGTSCSNNEVIDDSYGDIAGQLDVVYDRDVTVGGENRLRAYGSFYSDLTGVAYGGEGNTTGPAEIFLQPLSGFQVTLLGFDLGAWPNQTRNSQVTILNGAGQVLSPSTALTVDGQVHSHLSYNFTSADGIRIQWGPDNYDVGIDNVEFALSAVGPAGVPEPASWALMIAGFGMAGVALRRRSTVPAS